MGWRLCWTVREDSDGNYTDVTNTGGIIDRQDLSPTLQTDGHTHTSVAAISWRAYSPSFKKKKKEKIVASKTVGSHGYNYSPFVIYCCISRDFSSSSYRVVVRGEFLCCAI